jgi:hypothetical protein
MWWDFAEKHVSPSFFFANLFWLKAFWLELGINLQATAGNQIVLSKLLGKLVWVIARDIKHVGFLALPTNARRILCLDSLQTIIAQGILAPR